MEIIQIHVMQIKEIKENKNPLTIAARSASTMNNNNIGNRRIAKYSITIDDIHMKTKSQLPMIVKNNPKKSRKFSHAYRKSS